MIIRIHRDKKQDEERRRNRHRLDDVAIERAIVDETHEIPLNETKNLTQVTTIKTIDSNIGDGTLTVTGEEKLPK